MEGEDVAGVSVVAQPVTAFGRFRGWCALSHLHAVEVGLGEFVVLVVLLLAGHDRENAAGNELVAALRVCDRHGRQRSADVAI